MIGNEQLTDKIAIDILNKKITVFCEENSKIVFKCSTINELVDLKEKCSQLLKSTNFIYR